MVYYMLLYVHYSMRYLAGKVVQLIMHQKKSLFYCHRVYLQVILLFIILINFLIGCFGSKSLFFIFLRTLLYIIYFFYEQERRHVNSREILIFIIVWQPQILGIIITNEE